MRDSAWGRLSVPIASGFRSSVFLVTVVLVLIRCLVGLHPYSGQGTPPMYGDYEAQRHWMEITANLPAKDWYTYDVQYWGLDYPPLSAFHSYLFGRFFKAVVPELVELNASRGLESMETKAWMRGSVLLCDLLLFLPVAWVLVSVLSKPGATKDEAHVTYFFIGSLPALLLIDHGHFQYNGVSIGLSLLSFSMFFSGRDVTASVMYALSVLFKHMSLYYLPAVAGLILGRIGRSSKDVRYFLAQVFAVLFTTAVVFLPWIRIGPLAIQTVIERLFPRKRGIFEDKVANVWCTVSLVFKVKHVYSNEALSGASAIATLAFSFPFARDAFRCSTNKREARARIVQDIAGSALAFFLFAYQVHEKQILLPLSVGAFLLPYKPLLVVWWSIIGTFSLSPLLFRDGLALAYVALIALQVLFLFTMVREATRNMLSLVGLSLVGCIILHILQLVGPRIDRYPDLYIYLMTIYSCLHFLFFYCVFCWEAFTRMPKTKVS